MPGTRVSSGLFRTLGVAPVLGRDFLPGEDSAAAAHAVILSYTAWQKRFGGKQDVLGRTITLNRDPTIIIGVLPRKFQFALYDGGKFWGNLRVTGSCEQSRDCHNLITIARLKQGVSGAALLLLIAFVNVTTLPVARSVNRQQEIAMRGALGAFGLGDVVVSRRGSVESWGKQRSTAR